MPGKMPNGNEPVENGIRNNQDIKDDSASLKGKGKKAASKDGDDEMTVVVQPAKASKQPPTSSQPQQDDDGDVAMDTTADATVETENNVDPATQTLAGKFHSFLPPPFHFAEAVMVASTAIDGP